MATDPLEMIDELSTLHKVAVKTMHVRDSAASVAYEMMATDLAQGMMSVAGGADANGIAVDLIRGWRVNAQQSHEPAAPIFRLWAANLESRTRR